MSLIRRATLRTALPLLLLAVPAAALQQSETAKPQPGQETSACKCTCEACLARHGVKPQAVLDQVVLDQVEPPSPVEREPLAPDERGYMGVLLAEVDGQVSFGSVVPNSPAAKAGLLAGDIVIAAEELPVRTPADLQTALAFLRPGELVTIELERDSEELVVAFPLGERAVLDAGSTTLIATAIPAPDPLPVVEGLVRGQVIVQPEGEAEAILVELHGMLDVEVPSETVERIELEDVTDTIVLPTETPPVARLSGIGYVGDSGDETEEVEIVVRRRESPPKPADALPEGYIEIETRRERRPASSEGSAELRERLVRLEAEVAELTEMIESMRTELRRRNPR